MSSSIVGLDIGAAATMRELDAIDGNHLAPRFSVLIGRVSTEDSGRVLELLDALRHQEGSPDHEVIVADRRLDRITELIRDNYPEVRLLLCAAESPLPELRARALECARGEYIVVTEDHCVPPKHWLANMLEAFEAAPKGTVAVGGPVENGVSDSALDWATFLCEYSAFVGPLPNGPAPSLPGMNIAYHRSALVGLGREVLTRGFWETTVHPLFTRKNLLLYQSNSIQIFHKKRFSLRLFAHQRFLYSRYYAGLRRCRLTPMTRFLMSVLTLGLPALLLLRIGRNLMVKKRLIPQFARALPYLTVFVLIWACGEVIGYVTGPGDALSQVE
jgi:Glycosyl transferase family 2